MEDTAITVPLSSSVRLVLQGTELHGGYNRRKTAKLWKRALRKLQCTDLDPWLDFPTHTIPVHTAVRHRFSALKKKWVVDEITIRMEEQPFDRGAMRECFRLKKLPNSDTSAADWQHASNYVAKRYISKVDRQVYFDDVRLQMEAKLWGEAFNRHNPPKKVDIFQLSVIEIRRWTPAETGSKGDSNNSEELYHIERFMEGEYRKYNSNSGFVDEQLRNTPQAFSHFTFERSGHRLLVVDIQGVGDLYTDPQIHTSDGVGYSDGNLGTRGMAYFFHSHQCNPLCEYLGLTPFDLAPSELPDLSPPANDAINQHDNEEDLRASADEDVPSTDYLDSGSAHANRSAIDPSVLNKQTSSKRPLRRRSVSFSQSSSSTNRFGPTIARSTESIHSGFSLGCRQRADSLSVFSDGGAPSNFSNEFSFERFSSLTALEDEHSNTLAALKLSTGEPVDKFPVHLKVHLPLQTQSSSIGTESFPKPLYTAEAFVKPRPVRNRVASGDSGYYGRVNLRSPSASGHCDSPSTFAHNLIVDPLCDMFRGVSVSLTEHSFPTSANSVGGITGVPFHSTLGTGDEDLGLPLSRSHYSPFDLYPHPGGRFFGAFALPRRRRNISESSDLDVEEDRRMAGNLLHQLMHESHRPSCAGHPTNLDQEIGQSVLGQIHHELARLHEAGKFIPTCKGGWSHAGLGGHLLANSTESGRNSVRGTDQEIDWAAVLFHERHAAQLGCLEAMIVMAHYHLGLPTQLLFDCPIKPIQNDLRSGVDYLWRAAEGGDRRCMILLARYLDVAAALSASTENVNDPRDFLFLPMLQSLSPDMLPSVSPDSWAEAVVWYQKAVDTACAISDGQVDEGLDAEGGYDAAEDLLPVYRILGRMAEMYSVGGFGLRQDFNRVGELFAQAGELALAAMQGRLATKYFTLSEDAYSKIQ